MFLKIFKNIFSVRQTCNNVARICHGRATSQCFRHNVSSFCRGLTVHWTRRQARWSPVFPAASWSASWAADHCTVRHPGLWPAPTRLRFVWCCWKLSERHVNRFKAPCHNSASIYKRKQKIEYIKPQRNGDVSLPNVRPRQTDNTLWRQHCCAPCGQFFCVQDTNLCRTQMLYVWQNESTFGKDDHVRNVAATMCSCFADPLRDARSQGPP